METVKTEVPCIDYLDVIRDYAVGWGQGTLCLPVGMITMARIYDHAIFVHWISLLKWGCRS